MGTAGRLSMVSHACRASDPVSRGLWVRRRGPKGPQAAAFAADDELHVSVSACYLILLLSLPSFRQFRPMDLSPSGAVSRGARVGVGGDGADCRLPLRARLHTRSVHIQAPRWPVGDCWRACCRRGHGAMGGLRKVWRQTVSGGLELPERAVRLRPPCHVGAFSRYARCCCCACCCAPDGWWLR
jgi:hypothetical protein